MTEAKAKLKYLRVAPRKVRLVVDMIRQLHVSEAEAELSLLRKKASGHVLKLLHSAIANAKQKKMDTQKLFIKEIFVDEGPKLKRYMPRMGGRVGEIQKKMSHITMVLEETEKVHGRDFIFPIKEKKISKEKERKAKQRSKKKMEKDIQPEEKREKEIKPVGERGVKRFFRRKSV